MHDTIQHLEDKLNVPRRVKRQLSEHPLKWVIPAVGAGVIAASVVPLMLRAGSKGWVRDLLTPVLRIAIVTGLPRLMHLRESEVSNPQAG
ncbi:hypothetical protein AYO49_03135 [Verrucomicrobiaceae bacterium SCGC AG-212-N21]|nr:hypothetical protein AYO49_03135 [Verrucomicrobiaceae bacterium SCGC AG-212-N21]